MANNKIIAISGEPVSGKGTVVKQLIESLKNEGYPEDNIHIISTGKKFRNFFEKIIKFIENANNDEKIEELAKDEQMQEIFKYREYRNVLTRTIEKVQKEHIDIESLHKIADTNNNEIFTEVRNVVDYLIDNETMKMGQEINSKERPNEVWIFDSRMAFDNIPSAFSVRLTVNPKEAAKRLFNDSSRGEEDKYESIEDAEKEREERRIGEIQRYKDTYNVDLENPNNYDLIIDTSYASVEDVADTILACEKESREGNLFGKTWASPLTMVPCQTLGETWETQFGSIWTLKELTEDIKKEGYYPECDIKVFKINGINYILEGHHRNFACILAGKTLIPYTDLSTTEYGKNRIKNGTIPSTRSNYIFDHEALVEDALRKNTGDLELKFSYIDIYPNLLEEIEKPVYRGDDR